MNRVQLIARAFAALFAVAAGSTAVADSIQIETTTGHLASLAGTDLVCSNFGGARTIDLSSIPGFAGCSFTLAVAGLSNDADELWNGDQGFGMRATTSSNYGPDIDGDRVGCAGAYRESVRLTITNPVNLTDVRWNALLFGDGSTDGISLFDLANGEQVSLTGDATGTLTGDGSAFSFVVPGNPTPTAGGLTANAISSDQGGWYLRGFLIDATAVPEPSTATLLALMGGCAWIFRRKRVA